MGLSLQLEFTSWEVVMIAKVALLCLLASVAQAAPKPDADPFYGVGPYAINPPVCNVETEDFELQNCVPTAERTCSTADVASEEITYEKRCKTVTSNVCPGGIGAGVLPVIKKREADPQFFHAGIPHHVAPVAAATATVTVKHACHEVATEHCADVPIVKEVITPVETCHVVTKVTCTPTVEKLAKTVCKEPEEQTIDVGYHGYPYGYGK